MIHEINGGWLEPVEAVHAISEVVTEMSGEDHAFLCEMIKRRNPRKVLEVGVAEGGTSAIIHCAVAMLRDDYQIFSLDLCKEYYRDSSLETGYEYKRIEDKLSHTGSHEFILGYSLAEKMESIGGDIDLVILDTNHVMPGENLDFIAALPYLSADALVVLHDVSYSYLISMSPQYVNRISAVNSVSTRVLFSTVVGEKYVPKSAKYNIAAFQVDADTRKYIGNVLIGLGLPWTYVPSEDMVNDYKNIYSKHYESDILRLFDEACERNSIAVKNVEQARDVINSYQVRVDGKYQFPFERVPYRSKILLYGAGKCGKNMYYTLNSISYCEIIGWYDKNWEMLSDILVDVKSPKYMETDEADYIIIAVESQSLFDEIYREISDLGYVKSRIVIGPIKRIE